MSSETPRKIPARLMRQFATAFELPFILVGAIFVGGALGFFIDRRLGTKPYLMLALGAVGFGVGLRDMLRRLKASDGNGSAPTDQC